MLKVPIDKWLPTDGLKLEKNAIDVIKAHGNTLVIAGPGSGKTELLAQKACYLLQTGVCLYPKKILAISFKRDAAYNIRERVIRRCGDKLSKRFDSFTFDAFAKRILDRFRNGLPKPYDIASNYVFMEKPQREIPDIFKSINPTYFYTNGHKYDQFLTNTPLPHDESNSEQQLLQSVWLNLINRSRPMVDFRMVSRMAEYILSSNPQIRSYLQQTYSHIFLDEFQDTTNVQYELLRTCFADCDINYTAVGDGKQTIMGFAGAMRGIFHVFISDTDAKEYPLITNFRSAPKLIKLQNYLVEHLLQKTEFAIPSPNWSGGEGEARMCFFKSQSDEVTYLVAEMEKWIQQEGIPPREICVLVKQLPPQYTSDLIGQLSAVGVHAREENVFQDILSEEITLFLINFLTLIFKRRFGKESDAVFRFLCYINNSYDDRALLRLKKDFLNVVRLLAGKYKNGDIKPDDLKYLVQDIVAFADVQKIKASFSQYRQGYFFRDKTLDLIQMLEEYYSNSNDMVNTLDSIIGEDSIPVMTTHKSKGLEYHTVVFVGLEDDAFWTYKTQANSDNNLLFVALSRAKERVLFTFCANRPSLKNRDQTAKEIEKIHSLLCDSEDVEVEDYRK